MSVEDKPLTPFNVHFLIRIEQIRFQNIGQLCHCHPSAIVCTILTSMALFVLYLSVTLFER